MAYRRLCAVTFAVFGLLAAGCGGDTNTNVSGSDPAQQPPINKDQPPSSSDQASNPDQAPSNPDQPINNETQPAGTGGGGRLGALCQDLCNSIEQLGDKCSNGMASMGDTKSLCSAGCVVPASILPCEKEISDVFSCLIDNLQLLCTAVNNEDQSQPGRDPQPNASTCQDAVKSYTTCADAHGLNDDNTDNNAVKCSKAGGCDCPTDCASCTCDAGTDQDKLAACLDSCANP